MNREARQALYDRIRKSSKDQVILDEMTRLGFWPPKSSEKSSGTAAGTPAIEEPQELIKRTTELNSRLGALLREQHQISDPEVALKNMRKQRMKESRERRVETRRRNEEQRYQRSRDWWERRKTNILHVGDGYSAGLNHVESNVERLKANSLPTLNDATGLARAMGISLAELRFLTHARRSSKISHYEVFALPKKTGGERVISAPKPRLKRAQYWVLENLLNGLPVHEAAHGFMPGKSVVSNAEPHVGARVVINSDLKDFFPSVSYPRIKGLFQAFGYSENVATLLALICTQQHADEVELDGETWYIGHGERVLPQGAPTSPMLTNILCRKMDARLAGMASKEGWHYTRYADDMTFSTLSREAKPTTVLWRLRKIAESEGFTLHPDKTRVMHAGRRQEVTGVVVNQKLSIDRDSVRRARAAVNRLQKDGVDALQWNGKHGKPALAALRGWLNWLSMVDSERAKPLQQQLRKHDHGSDGWLASGRMQGFRQASAAGKAPWDGWWTAAEKPEPELPLLLQPKPERIIDSGGAEQQASSRSSRRRGFDIVQNPWQNDEVLEPENEQLDENAPWNSPSEGASLGRTMFRIGWAILWIYIVLKLFGRFVS